MADIVNMERKIDVEKLSCFAVQRIHYLVSTVNIMPLTVLGSSEISETLYNSHQLSKVL